MTGAETRSGMPELRWGLLGVFGVTRCMTAVQGLGSK